MAPSYTNIPLSPAELSYLHTSLSQTPPIRPDGRAPTQFRPLVAETAILPLANGSARVCFADGTEAVVGVKGEVVEAREESWVEVSMEIPGMRDDDALPVFLSAMLTEALLADEEEGGLKGKLGVNRRFHWRLFVDILLLSQPLSYPLPLLSLTTHLALLSTRLPALISEKDEDPLFNDDWETSHHLYPDPSSSSKPPITLLVMSVGPNILFDPSKDELAVADSVLAISAAGGAAPLNLLALRTIDPPSRLTGAGAMDTGDALAQRERDVQGWRPPRGGVKRGLVGRMVEMVVAKGGVGEEVLDGLVGVET